jgi:hypothetical protein
MKRLLILLAMMFVMPLANADAPVAKISVLASGKLLLDGSPTTLTAIDEALQKLQTQHGSVWYYRENADSEPPAIATDVINLIIKHRLPASLSTKPDFSDAVGPDGQSHPGVEKSPPNHQ